MTLTCTIVVENEVDARIAGLRPEHLTILWEKFGIYVDGYRYTREFQFGHWDGKSRFFQKTGKTYTRLLEEVLPYLDTWHYEINFEDQRIPPPALNTVITDDFFNLPDFKFRDYQVVAANKLLEAGGGFGILATGSGKTGICAVLAAVLHSKGLQTLVIVPSTDLVNQTADDFRLKFANLDLTVGTYSGGVKDIHQPVVVATWQSLQHVPHLMVEFQAVIVDESHSAKAEVIKELINVHGKHIAYRWGVTGTWPKPLVDQYSLKCSIGQIACNVPASYLIERGFLSRIDIETIETQEAEEEFPDYGSEKTFLSKSPARLEVLATEIQTYATKHGNTLVLVNSIAQGQALQELIEGSVFLHGESTTELRKQNYDQYAERNDLIIIATFGIASTGLSIDRIFSLIMIDAGKSFIKCIQTIGRGLRKKGDKDYIMVVDFYSKMKFSKKHAKERRAYYKDAEYPCKAPRKLAYSIASISNGLLLV